MKGIKMDLYKSAEKSMTMSDETWRRHSNPLSVYTRFAVLPLIVFAIWSRVWIGWFSLVPIAISLWWVWYNPRAFSPPRNVNNWASKGTFGERFFLKRKNYPIEKHHVRFCHFLTILSATGLPIMIYGLAVYNFWATVCGMVLIIFGKMWFVDRMVWIFDDMLRLEIPEAQNMMKIRKKKRRRKKSDQ